jgi:hypothetical protein
MADDASEVLGSPEIAHLLVNPKGLAKRATGAAAGSVVGGMVGTFAAKRVLGDQNAGAPDVPSFGRVGYLAATVDEIALLKTRTGWKMRMTDTVLARVPRTEITGVEWDGGMLVSHLVFTFANGVRWEFDVPRNGKKDAKAFVDAIGGTTG